MTACLGRYDRLRREAADATQPALTWHNRVALANLRSGIHTLNNRKIMKSADNQG